MSRNVTKDEVKQHLKGTLKVAGRGHDFYIGESGANIGLVLEGSAETEIAWFIGISGNTLTLTDNSGAHGPYVNSVEWV